MAKKGMPTVDIQFREKGIEAIERSKRGIVMLLLEDKKATIGKLPKNPLTLYGVDDTPNDLSDKNKDYILQAFKGYDITPYRVKIYVQDDVNTNGEADKFKDSLAAILPERWDVLAVPTIKSTQLENVGTWMKTSRVNKFKRSTVVLPGYSGDDEGIINFSNKKIVCRGDKEYTPAEFTARIAGMICGTSSARSVTYAPLSEVVDCDKYPIDENVEKVNKGELFIFFDGEKFKMSRGINSLVTTGQDKLEAYQSIRSVFMMDMIFDDIKKTAEDSYIGKYVNDYDNKMLLIEAIEGYFLELEKARILQKGVSKVELDLEAIKIWQMKHGKYSKEELANMDDLAIAKLDTKTQVFLQAKIVILETMEDIVLPINI